MSFTTWLYTRLFGKLVGMDEFGNNYYCTKNTKLNERERRWVLFKGDAEPSSVPPEWHAWLHHTIERPLSEQGVYQAEWQLQHIPNLTGTSYAYQPGSNASGRKPKTSISSDYESWNPK